MRTLDAHGNVFKKAQIVKPVKRRHPGTRAARRRKRWALGLSFLLCTLRPRERFESSVGFTLVLHGEFVGGCFCVVLLWVQAVAPQPRPLRSGHLLQWPWHLLGAKDQLRAAAGRGRYLPCSSWMLCPTARGKSNAVRAPTNQERVSLTPEGRKSDCNQCRAKT